MIDPFINSPPEGAVIEVFRFRTLYFAGTAKMAYETMKEETN